ncbi:MAG TPA: metalloregulator ArsR/SmtB family transcription factor [Polyangiaceae bacterium]|nr:metalloregulator ArsR/SmtB family transcription factor [Polyangiaceae bacterium]
MKASPVHSSKPARLDALFGALADPTRRAILARLALGEATVSELAEPHRLTQPTISKHLKVLEAAGLISTARDAQRRPRRLEVSALAAADGWFEPFRKLWEARYGALDRVLEEMADGAPPPAMKKAKARRKP